MTEERLDTWQKAVVFLKDRGVTKIIVTYEGSGDSGTIEDVNYYDKDDDERSKFIYYSNSKTIPYKYLDAVARKFVCAHKCPNIYVFIRDELMKEIKRIEEEEKKREEAQSDAA